MDPRKSLTYRDQWSQVWKWLTLAGCLCQLSLEAMKSLDGRQSHGLCKARIKESSTEEFVCSFFFFFTHFPCRREWLPTCCHPQYCDQLSSNNAKLPLPSEFHWSLASREKEQLARPLADSNLYKNNKRTLNEKYVELKLFKNYFLV